MHNIDLVHNLFKFYFQIKNPLEVNKLLHINNYTVITFQKYLSEYV